MKQIQIIIPDRGFGDVNKILKETKVRGVSHHRIEYEVEEHKQKKLLLEEAQ